MPLFYFFFEKIDYEERPTEQQDVMRFMRDVMDKMQLTTECIVISLIYLELVMIKGNIEIRDFNWRPLVFTAILLASKFWEDIIWYNVDFVDNLELYNLKSINRLESEFISLCDYNIYVSAEKYDLYQRQIREMSFPDGKAVRTRPNEEAAPASRPSGFIQRILKSASFNAPALNRLQAQTSTQQHAAAVGISP